MFAPVRDKDKRRQMQMQYLQQTQNIQQEPMPERIDVGEYLDALSQINTRRSKMAGRVNAMRGLTGRSQNFSFGAIAGEQELKQRMGIRDEEIQAEILNRQRAAILRGEINNIDEQMAWYQGSGFDPHFAKEARTAAQSIFDQRFQERGAEIRETTEKRQIRTQEMSEERLKIQIEQERRAAAAASRDKTERNLNALRDKRKNTLVAWGADKWWKLPAAERTEAKKEEIGRELMELSRDENFQGFETIAGERVPKTGRGDLTLVAPVPIDLDEEAVLKSFRDEIKVPAEDEDFVTVPAREYFDKYKEGWNVAADDFDTARDYAAGIDAAIAADPNIAPENKQAVLEKVLKNLESVEKGVGRPTEKTPQAAVVREKRLEDRLFERTENIKSDMANSTRVFNELMDRYSQNNPYLAQMTLGLREAQVFDRMISIMSYGPNPLSMSMVDKFRNDVAAAGDDTATVETHLRWFAEANRIPIRMAEYILDPEEYKKRQF